VEVNGSPRSVGDGNAHARFTAQTGAVPVYRGNTLLGALGASGGTGEQDEEMCARTVSATGFNTSA